MSESNRRLDSNRGAEFVVAADDRSGAFEVAGRLADCRRDPVSVTVWPDGKLGAPDENVAVIDLATRHLSPAEARRRATALPTGRRSGHKIDSTLRGNWADELAGRAEQRPVLLVPALPEFGRVCRRGEVLELGRPVHEGAAASDVRRRVTCSRPADLLRAAGAGRVVELADREAVVRWLAAPAGVAVADAATDDEIAEIVGAWTAGPENVVLAGTSVVLGCVDGDSDGDSSSDSHRPSGRRIRTTARPVLVVCGSVHPLARAQLAFAERRGLAVTSVADDAAVRRLTEHRRLALVTEIPVGDVDTPMAIAAATSLARGFTELEGRVELGAVVVIGGDTLAAVVGSRAAQVHGTVEPGTAWATVAEYRPPLVTRSGGFGSEAALVDLLRRVAG